MNNPLPGFVLSVTGAFGVLALVAGFVPDVSGPEVRRPYTEGAVQSGATSAVTRPLSHIVWNVRGTLAESHFVRSSRSAGTEGRHGDPAHGLGRFAPSFRAGRRVPPAAS